MRVVVVGASSGLGRFIGIDLAQHGMRTALLARRADRLEAAVAEAGPNALAITCDVTDEAGCKEAIEKAASELGGIDALVYATGIGTLKKLGEVDATTWRDIFDTNVVGAAVATSAALPYLEAARGTAVYLSSVSASYTSPWPALGSYAVSKAALDKLTEAFRADYPGVGFTRVSIGMCLGGDGDSTTAFSHDWDMALAGEMYQTWMTKDFLNGAFLDVAELSRVVRGVLDGRNGTIIPQVVVTVRPPVA